MSPLPCFWKRTPNNNPGCRAFSTSPIAVIFFLCRCSLCFFFVLRAMCQPSISSNSSCRLPNYIIFLFLCRSLYKSLAVYCKARWARTMRLQVLSPVTILLYPLLLTRVPSPGLRVCTRLRTVVVLRFIRFIDVHSTDCSLFFPFFLTNCTRHCLCWTGRTVIKKVRFL